MRPSLVVKVSCSLPSVSAHLLLSSELSTTTSARSPSFSSPVMFPQSLLPKFTNPVTGVQNFLFKILELIGPGQIIDFPRENDGYQGKEYRYLRLVLR